MTVVMESSSKLILQTKAARWGSVKGTTEKRKQQRRVSTMLSQLKLHKFSSQLDDVIAEDGMKNNTRNLTECLSIAVNVISFTFSSPTKASVLTILSSFRRIDSRKSGGKKWGCEEKCKKSSQKETGKKVFIAFFSVVVELHRRVLED